VIKSLPPKTQIGFPFFFKVDFQANYFMMIETEYTSQHFSEQLKRFLNAHPDTMMDSSRLQ